jgi:hypothetical protein
MSYSIVAEFIFKIFISSSFYIIFITNFTMWVVRVLSVWNPIASCKRTLIKHPLHSLKKGVL